MGMRDWLIIIVIVGIVIILADGYRRKHKNAIRMKLDKNIPPADKLDNDPLERAELPNGGARVLGRDAQPLATYPDSEASDEEYLEDDYHDERERDEDDSPQEDNVPVLMDTVDIAGAESNNDAGTAARNFADDTSEASDETIDSEYMGDENSDESRQADSPEHDLAPETYASEEDHAAEDYDDEFDSDEIVSPVRVNHREGSSEKPKQESRNKGRIEPSLGELGPLSAEDLEDRPAHLRETKKHDKKTSKKTKKSRFFKSGKANDVPEKNNDSDVLQTELFSDTPQDYFQEDEEDTQVAEPEEVIVINVMARTDEYFSGKDMLPIILQQGMQLGKMSIFHKHADSDGNGPIMFSMANMVKPGTFDISQMDEFTTPGVSFFLQLPNKLGNMKCFEQMLEAANHIRETLHGELKDEQRSVITRQTIEHCRQRIQDFELAQLSKK